uniref:Lipocalin n=1 Tax=Rhipicephalus zambeziensis TaxID=60191 RepID=A0A224Y7L2_9ACAR
MMRQKEQTGPRTACLLVLSVLCVPSPFRAVSSHETVPTSSSPEPFRAWDLTIIRPSNILHFLHMVLISMPRNWKQFRECSATLLLPTYIQHHTFLSMQLGCMKQLSV